MKEFSDVLSKKSGFNLGKVDTLIEEFNKEMLRGKQVNADRSLSLNTTLHNVPKLTQEEFLVAISRAEKKGYSLESFDDEHFSTTYKLKVNE